MITSILVVVGVSLVSLFLGFVIGKLRRDSELRKVLVDAARSSLLSNLCGNDRAVREGDAEEIQRSEGAVAGIRQFMANINLFYHGTHPDPHTDSVVFSGDPIGINEFDQYLKDRLTAYDRNHSEQEAVTA